MFLIIFTDTASNNEKRARMVDANKINEGCKLESQQTYIILKMIDDQYKEIENDLLFGCQVENLPLNKLLSYAMFLGEMNSFLSGSEKCNELIFILIKEMKGRIESKDILDLNLCDGLVYASVILNVLSKNTGKYKKFANQVECYVLEEIRTKLKVLSNVEQCRTEYYDLIYGASAWILYLVEFSNHSDASTLIKDILKYLLKLTHYKQIDGTIIPGWYVKFENMLSEDQKEMFPGGHCNFGLSHGIAGILLALSLAYNKGIEIEGQKEAISDLIVELEKRSTKINNIVYWPGFLTLEEFQTNAPLSAIQRNSWCYGNVGILCSLYHAAKALNKTNIITFVENQINQLAKLKAEDHLLKSPVICHGYSGLILLFDWASKNHISNDLGDGIRKISNIIINLKDTEYGLSDLEINGDKRETFAVLDGAMGCILTLASLLKDDLSFQKTVAFI